MGELYGRSEAANHYSIGMQAARLSAASGGFHFSTKEFVNRFNDAKRARRKNWEPDRKNTCANDTLRTLVTKEVGVLKQEIRGMYTLVATIPRYAPRKFNEIYPLVKKGEYYKDKMKSTKTKRTACDDNAAEKKSLGLTKLGSNTTQYKYEKPSIDILETFINKHPDQLQLVTFTMPRDEFSSLCPVTGQPDQARIEVVYVPSEKMVESKSLKLYLFSFRNHGSFHEDIVQTIHKTLWTLLAPKYLRVFGDFSPRGGIAIKPIVDKFDRIHITAVESMDICRMIQMWDTKGSHS